MSDASPENPNAERLAEIVSMRLAGKSTREIGRAIGLHHSNVARVIRSPGFEALVSSERHATIVHARREISALLPEAVARLRAQLNDPEPKISQRAVEMVLVYSLPRVAPIREIVVDAHTELPGQAPRVDPRSVQ